MEHHGRGQVIDKADGLMKVRGVCGGRGNERDPGQHVPSNSSPYAMICFQLVRDS